MGRFHNLIKKKKIRNKNLVERDALCYFPLNLRLATTFFFFFPPHKAGTPEGQNTVTLNHYSTG